MAVVRQVLGELLRRRRTDQDRTLRDVAAAARVSLGYLSEVERGQKEASSELLAAICGALDVPMSVILHELADELAVLEAIPALVDGAEEISTGTVVASAAPSRTHQVVAAA